MTSLTTVSKKATPKLSSYKISSYKRREKMPSRDSMTRKLNHLLPRSKVVLKARRRLLLKLKLKHTKLERNQ